MLGWLCGWAGLGAGWVADTGGVDKGVGAGPVEGACVGVGPGAGACIGVGAGAGEGFDVDVGPDAGAVCIVCDEKDPAGAYATLPRDVRTVLV